MFNDKSSDFVIQLLALCTNEANKEIRKVGMIKRLEELWCDERQSLIFQFFVVKQNYLSALYSAVSVTQLLT
jgi:hypothetical protein